MLLAVTVVAARQGRRGNGADETRGGREASRSGRGRAPPGARAARPDARAAGAIKTTQFVRAILILRLFDQGRERGALPGDWRLRTRGKPRDPRNVAVRAKAGSWPAFARSLSSRRYRPSRAGAGSARAAHCTVML